MRFSYNKMLFSYQNTKKFVEIDKDNTEEKKNEKYKLHDGDSLRTVPNRFC